MSDNSEIKYIPNNQSIQTNSFERVISSPNLLPAINGVIKLASQCLDLHKQESERQQSAADLAKAMREFDVYDEELEQLSLEMQTSHEYVRYLMRIGDKFAEKGELDAAMKIAELISSTMDKNRNKSVDLFNRHSNRGKIIIVDNEN